MLKQLHMPTNWYNHNNPRIIEITDMSGAKLWLNSKLMHLLAPEASHFYIPDTFMTVDYLLSMLPILQQNSEAVCFYDDGQGSITFLWLLWNRIQLDTAIVIYQSNLLFLLSLLSIFLNCEVVFCFCNVTPSSCIFLWFMIQYLWWKMWIVKRNSQPQLSAMADNYLA